MVIVPVPSKWFLHNWMKLSLLVLVASTHFNMPMSLQVFSKGIDKEMVVLMAARASRLENQDAIDTAIVSMLTDPKEVLSLIFKDVRTLYI